MHSHIINLKSFLKSREHSGSKELQWVSRVGKKGGRLRGWWRDGLWVAKQSYYVTDP